MVARRYVIALALTLICTVVFGGLIHAAVPHSHGNNTVMWDDLHSVLYGEGKKTPVPAQPYMLLVFALLAVALSSTQVPKEFLFAPLRDPVLGEALRRGVTPHRAFR